MHVKHLLSKDLYSLLGCKHGVRVEVDFDGVAKECHRVKVKRILRQLIARHAKNDLFKESKQEVRIMTPGQGYVRASYLG